MSYQFDPILGTGCDGSVSLTELQKGYDAGTAAQKAAFQASVSADVSTFAALTARIAVSGPTPRVTFASGSVQIPAQGSTAHYQANVDFRATRFDGSGVLAGNYAVTLGSYGFLDSTTFRAGPCEWNGLIIDMGAGPGNGLRIHSPSWNVSYFSLVGAKILGGSIGLTFGDHVWISELRNGLISGQTDVGALLTAGNTTGEGLNFYNTTFASVKNANGTGIAVKTVQGASRGNWKLYGCSFDYSDKAIYHGDGYMLISGGHIESDGPGAYVTVSQDSGTTVSAVLDGVEFWYQPGTSIATALVETSGGVAVDVLNCDVPNLANQETLEILRVNSGSPRVRIKGGNFGLWQGISQSIGIISRYTSLIRNGQFDNSSSGWRMLAVNYLRNSNFSGGVSGSPGTNPTWVTDSGATNGLTRTLTFTDYDGRRVMRVQYTGTPTANGTVGFSLWGDPSTRIKASVGNKLSLRAYLKYNALSGATAMSAQLTERDAAGAALISQSGYAANPFVKTLVQFDATLTNASTASVQPNIYWQYTSGTAVNIDVEISCPSLMLSGMDYADILRVDTSAALSSVRYSVDATGGYNSAPCLRITSSGDSGGVYQDVPVLPGDWLVVRGYVKFDTGTTGSAGYVVHWLDVQGNEISNQIVRPTYLTSAATWTQHSGVRVVPQGAFTARIECHVEALTGAALFDDALAWVL